MEEQAQVSNRVRIYREAAGLSRWDLVVALAMRGVKYSEPSIYKLETGRQVGTSVERAAILAQVLSEHLGKRVTMEDLFPVSLGSQPLGVGRKAEDELSRSVKKAKRKPSKRADKACYTFAEPDQHILVAAEPSTTLFVAEKPIAGVA